MRVFFICLLCLFVFLMPAQNASLNNALKFHLQRKANASTKLALLVKGNVEQLLSLQDQGHYTVNYSAGDIASISCNSAALDFMVSNRLIASAELIQPHTQPMNDTMVVRNRIKAVKLWTAPLPQAYNGEGILVGLIDTGVDFNHNDFKDSLGHSRIRFLWDQVPTSGSSVPAPYNYGIEWTDAQINAGLCTHNDLGHYGHGTHVTGIAAGNGLANHTHEGCASKADIVMVALDFDRSGPSIADAVNYIFSKAALLNKPCVINISVGDYYGSHDGTNLEAKLIDNMVSNIPGRVIVAAAGNAGNIKHHVKTEPATGDTLFTWLRNGTISQDYWCYADTAQIRHLNISIGANRTNYSDLGRIGFKPYNYGLTTVQNDTLKHNNNRIGIVRTSASINSYGVYELYVHIDADSSNLNWRVETTGSGLHHAWNFDFVADNLPSVTQYPDMTYYVIPDTLFTIVTSFQCSDEIITVGNYINLNRYYDVNDTLRNTGETTGQLTVSSSVGPTRDLRQKPDITASGNNIFSCIALGMQANLIANLPTAVAPGSLHVIGGGTSASSPVVAGLSALYLQRFPTATNREIKTAIINCAYHDNFTGTQLPDYRWGYGKLDGKATMICNDNTNPLGVHELRSSTMRLHYYPNPFSENTRISLSRPVQGAVKVYTPDGKLIFTDVITSDTYDLRGSIAAGYSGLLFVKLITPDADFSFKLIKEN